MSGFRAGIWISLALLAVPLIAPALSCLCCCVLQMVMSKLNSTWHGGSMLASMPGSERFFITIEEFDARGRDVCEEKSVVKPFLPSYDKHTHTHSFLSLI